MKIYSVLGVDGSGKTTLLERLKRESSAPGRQYLRTPQFHLSVSTKWDALSQLLEDLGAEADLNSDPVTKACVLYWAMKLCRPILDEVCERRGTDDFEVVMERHPVLDGLTYAPFYLQYFDASTEVSGLDKFEMSPSLRSTFQTFMSESGCSGFSETPERIRTLFGCSNRELPAQLENEFCVPMPEKVLLLKLDESTLKERLISKGANRELHETAAALMMFQSAYERAAKLHALEYRELSTADMGLDEVEFSARSFFGEAKRVPLQSQSARASLF
ncbi:MAG: hypothetical protein AAF202_02500 [Pseudomonadota bacterium]